MKGIILAGGTGSRLMPCTKVTNKHLLPVGKLPMIMYPLHTLRNSGITDIMVVSGREHAGHFLEYLGSGEEWGVSIYYGVQEEAGGIAQALGLCRGFAGNQDIAVILGDNIFEGNFTNDVVNFERGAHIFLKYVEDPRRFGVAVIKNGKVTSIVEKPLKPKSKFAVTGFYLYDNSVFGYISALKPSKRGELEITDVNNMYVKSGKIKHTIINGFWSDAGTFETLHQATEYVRWRDGVYETKQNLLKKIRNF